MPDDMVFRFDDAHAFARKMAVAPEIVGKELTRAVDRITIQGEAYTKIETPVRTGHLRRSIAHKPAVFAGGVARGSWGTSTPYALPVEYGRRGFSARSGGVLRFVPKGSTKPIYRKRVGPAAGHFMFRKAKERIRPIVRREFRSATRNIVIQIVGR